MKIRTFVLGTIAALLVVGQSAAVSAATLYDGSGESTSSTSRGAENAPLAFFQFAEDVVLTGITSLIDPSSSGNAKFLIFENGAEVFSSELSFTDTGGFQQISSAPFTFNAKANTDYFIGSVLDVAALYNFSVGDDVQGIVSNISRNQNVSGFTNPSLVGQAGATIGVSLDGNVSAVPLPAVAPMLLAALGALGFVATRRSKKAA
ncbi:VPLPA-CTERM sorting domain-containing protein [Rhodobacteraceae bacterium NNCM2]|nr:VPLPA-CTERM sorting domain-containing protein [Coraliihabitans acroporae]